MDCGLKFLRSHQTGFPAIGARQVCTSGTLLLITSVPVHLPCVARKDSSSTESLNDSNLILDVNVL